MNMALNAMAVAVGTTKDPAQPADIVAAAPLLSSEAAGECPPVPGFAQFWPDSVTDLAADHTAGLAPLTATVLAEATLAQDAAQALETEDPALADSDSGLPGGWLPLLPPLSMMPMSHAQPAAAPASTWASLAGAHGGGDAVAGMENPRVVTANLHTGAASLPMDGGREVLADAVPTQLGIAPGGPAVDSVALVPNAPVREFVAVKLQVQGAGSAPLTQALAQRIQVQQAHGMDVATVRLDPPQMGALEVRIQQSAGGIQVWVNASHGEVTRQLSAVMEGLRQELQARSAGEVSVTVAHTPRHFGGQEQGQRQRTAWAWPAEETIGQALQEEYRFA